MRTWRIEFAVEGETDSSEGAKSQLDTPYSVKVFVRFTIGLLMGVVGFILSLIALLTVYTFPSLRPKGPETAGGWSLVSVKARQANTSTPSVASSRQLEPHSATPSSSPTPHQTPSSTVTHSDMAMTVPVSVLGPGERRVTFQLQQAKPGLSPSSELPTPGPNVLSINSPTAAQFLATQAQLGGSRFMEGSLVPASPSEVYEVTDSEKQGSERGSLSRKESAGQKNFMSRFKKKRRDDAKYVSDDERDGNTSSLPSRPSTPTQEASSPRTPGGPSSPSIIEDLNRPRRISLKLPGFKRRSISAASPNRIITVSSPESIGNVSLSSGTSVETSFSMVTSSSGYSTTPSTVPSVMSSSSTKPPTSQPPKRSKTFSFSGIARPPPPLRPDSYPISSSTDVPRRTSRERGRKLSLDEGRLSGLQLTVSDDAYTSQFGEKPRLLGPVKQRIVSDPTVSPKGEVLPADRKKRASLRSSSKPPVSYKPTRHDMMRSVHNGGTDVSLSDTEAPSRTSAFPPRSRS